MTSADELLSEAVQVWAIGYAAWLTFCGLGLVGWVLAGAAARKALEEVWRC